MHRNGKARPSDANGHLADSIFPAEAPRGEQPAYRWGGPGSARANGKSTQSILMRIAQLPILGTTKAEGEPRVLGSGWELRHQSQGRARFQNERLHRRREVCQAIERELMSVLGIDNYKTSDLTGSVLILYDPKQLSKSSSSRSSTRRSPRPKSPEGKDKADLHLPLCTVSLPLAAAAQFLVPPLLPVAAGLFLYTSIPTFQNAREVLFDERRLGVDVLDAIVVVGCLGTMQIFPGTVLCWCLGFGRVLVKKTQDDSKRLLLNAFGKQPRYVWLYRDGVEVQVAMDKLEVGDVIVVNTGEVVPVDGFIKEGMAMIDQHALTGESTPAEKGVGDRVFASTRDGRRQGLRRGREGGQRDRLGEDQPDPERHGRLQADLAAQGRAAGRQGRHPDAGAGQRRAWPRWGPPAPWRSSTATSAPASAWPRRWRCSPRWPCAPTRASSSRTAGPSS